MQPSRLLLLGVLIAGVTLVMLVFGLPVIAAPGLEAPTALTLENGHADFLPRALQQGGQLTPTMYLPFIALPPPPPVVDPIVNPLSTGVYDVTWQPVAGASAYTVEESSDPGFTTITGTTTGGPGLLSWAANQGRAGTWYYRVKAIAPSGGSRWSNVVATTASAGMAGVVKWQGIPRAQIHLRLRFYNGTDFSTVLETDTAANGVFRFTGAPTLATGQFYYVRYDNGSSGGNDTNLAFLAYWGGANIVSYQAGSSVPVDDLDIANVTLVSPQSGATAGLPTTFQWQPRPPAPGEGYWWELFVPGTNEFFDTNPLGYVNSYTLTALPTGFVPGVEYGWAAWVYDANGGAGTSYYYRTITVTGAEYAGARTAAGERQRTNGNHLEVLKAREAHPGIRWGFPGR